MKESALQTKFLVEVRKNKLIALKLESRTNTGFPDVLVIGPYGLHWFVEFKTLTGELTVKQEYIIDKLRKYKHNVFVCTEDNYDKIIEEILEVSL